MGTEHRLEHPFYHVQPDRLRPGRTVPARDRPASPGYALRMRPTARDVIGAALLTVILTALVLLLVIGAWAGTRA